MQTETLAFNRREAADAFRVSLRTVDYLLAHGATRQANRPENRNPQSGNREISRRERGQRSRNTEIPKQSLADPVDSPCPAATPNREMNVKRMPASVR
jgi:hypothetical protein